MFMCIILQFSYTGSEGIPVHVVQLNFLQLLSATAKQTFTYHCLNSAAWLDAATHSHEQALRFRGANGEDLTHENTHYVRALYDGCQVGNMDIHLTVHTPHFFFKPDCLIVFLCCRHARGKRGRCWNLTLRCPPHSPSSMLPCPILGRGTRNLVSKLAQFATMVSQDEGDYIRSNLIGKKEPWTLLTCREKTHSRLT